MPRTIIWSPKAIKDVADQALYIASDSRKAATLVKGRVEAAVKQLAQTPTGRPGRVVGTYEKSIPKTSLIVAYELVGEDKIQIIRVIHTSRDWQSESWPKDK